jgi:hypothetical protein
MVNVSQIRKHVMQKIVCLAILLMSISSPSFGADISGTWRFEKSSEYSGTLKNIPPPKNPVVQIANGKLAVSPTCSTSLEKQTYDYSEPFQMLLKDDAEEKAVTEYLAKNFSFTLPKNVYFSVHDTDDKCLAPFFDIFVTNNKQITVHGGSVFYSFVRTAGGADKPIPPNVMLYGHKLT